MKVFAYTFIYLFTCFGFSQTEHAWVYFKNKPDATSFLVNPNLMLTDRALDRREKQGIALDERDVPVDISYIFQVNNSMGVQVKAQSRWMNAVHVLGSEEVIRSLEALSFVNHIEFANKNITAEALPTVSFQKKNNLQQISSEVNTYNYGQSENQTEMLGVDVLHNLGYDGSGFHMAVIDAGFPGVNTVAAFSHLLDNDVDNGEILGGYDFVNQTDEFYNDTGSDHGTLVLSTIAGIVEDDFRGIAPKISAYLYVTEDVSSETPLEESLWVQAAERADSLGVDILSTSLGYNQFDENKYNYVYDDMDGETTFITRGANIAVEKGMLVLNSAGNSGSSPWKFITAPADAKGILAVGAVDANKNISSFSSFGPSADNRIKPEVLARGGGAIVIDKNGIIKSSNGTSFSCPIMAGASACLWQAFPDKTNLEIRQMIIDAADLVNQPEGQKGYGLPDFSFFTKSLALDDQKISQSLFFDKIIDGKLYFRLDNITKSAQINVHAITGKQVISSVLSDSENTIDVSSLSQGWYILKYVIDGHQETIKIYIQ